MASELTVSNQLAWANPLNDVNTKEGDQHQGNRQFAKMIKPHSCVHLHLQHNQMKRPVFASITRRRHPAIAS